MTAVSLINPYAPQPASGLSAEAGYAVLQSALPIAQTAAGSGTNAGSDRSGNGTGNGTGTGGAQLAALLEKGREAMPPQRPTPRSVVEAQSESDPATEFLARQARKQIEARAAEEARAADRAAMRAAEAKAEADRAALPEYVMPNPLPTAPILQREDS
jgi:hypothetical protein